MKSKFNPILSLLALFTITFMSSCLKKGLPDYPLYNGNEITLVNVEHRFDGNETMNGQPVVAYQKLDITQTIDENASTISVAISVPAANDQFTAAEKARVSQSKLWFYMNISTAAAISPTAGTPALGDPTDATKPLKYTVTAANGAKRVWTINVISFTNN